MTETWDFQLQMTQMLKASCLFSFKSILYVPQENVNLSNEQDIC